MPSLPTISHKHFRAMQGRKLCLAFPPTLYPLPLSDLPRYQLSELISAREIFHFCSQTLLGSNWNKPKTDKQSGQL